MGKTSKKVKEKRGRELQKVIVKQQEVDREEKAMSALKDEDLFEITEKSKGIKKKRYPLDPMRFKKKMWKFLGKSQTEEKMVTQLARKIVAGKVEKCGVSKKKDNELMDLWGDGENVTNRKVRRKIKSFRSCLPAVIAPHAGQSYNPSASDYKVARN